LWHPTSVGKQSHSGPPPSTNPHVQSAPAALSMHCRHSGEASGAHADREGPNVHAGKRPVGHDHSAASWSKVQPGAVREGGPPPSPVRPLDDWLHAARALTRSADRERRSSMLQRDPRPVPAADDAPGPAVADACGAQRATPRLLRSYCRGVDAYQESERWLPEARALFAPRDFKEDRKKARGGGVASGEHRFVARDFCTFVRDYEEKSKCSLTFARDFVIARQGRRGERLRQ
jgi:hypothetical protein